MRVKMNPDSILAALIRSDYQNVMDQYTLVVVRGEQTIETDEEHKSGIKHSVIIEADLVRTSSLVSSAPNYYPGPFEVYRAKLVDGEFSLFRNYNIQFSKMTRVGPTEDDSDDEDYRSCIHERNGKRCCVQIFFTRTTIQQRQIKDTKSCCLECTRQLKKVDEENYAKNLVQIPLH
ncbi:hypothetical protein [Carp edema virus]|nr:hypothetical protein [Carp edema virus]